MDKLTQLGQRIKVIMRLHEQLGAEIDELYKIWLEEKPQSLPSKNRSDENMIG